MKFLFYFLIFFLLFTSKGHFPYASEKPACPSIFSESNPDNRGKDASPVARDQKSVLKNKEVSEEIKELTEQSKETDRKITELVEQGKETDRKIVELVRQGEEIYKRITELAEQGKETGRVIKEPAKQVKETHRAIKGLTQEFDVSNYQLVRLVSDLSELFKYVGRYGNILGGLLEDLTEDLLSSAFRQLGVNIVNPKNQIIRNLNINNKEFDLILFEKNSNRGSNKKKKVFIIESKTSLREKNMRSLYNSMMGNDYLIDAFLSYLERKTKETFTRENTSIYVMFTFLSFQGRRAVQLINKARKYGVLLAKINVKEHKLEILNQGSDRIYDFTLHGD